MNYSIQLRVKMQNDNWIPLGDRYNISWDLRDLIEASCGWSVINCQTAGTASEFIPKLKKGILELTNHPQAYENYEIEHGLGTIKEVLTFYESFLSECQGHPFAEIYGCVA
jgi:hypothetical protein